MSFKNALNAIKSALLLMWIVTMVGLIIIVGFEIIETNETFMTQVSLQNDAKNLEDWK